MRAVVALAAASLILGAGHAGGTSMGQPVAAALPTYGYSIVRTYSHDRGAFTQGLEYLDGFLYESTGGYGRSTIRKVNLESGEVLQQASIPREHFGEGISIYGSSLFQLTWKSGIGWEYDLATLRPKRTFQYMGEGWGLTHDEDSLFMSDGTEYLRVLNPATLEERHRIRVTRVGLPVRHLNELEYVHGELFANVWPTDLIVRIDPRSGRVSAHVDLRGLLSPQETVRNAVLNGIAYDEAGDRLFVTGKHWPKLFEIKLVKR